MTVHYRACRVELEPTREQIEVIERTMGVCRYIYNLFISTNRDNYRNGSKRYIDGYEFSKWLNNDFREANPDKQWIWKVPSKSVKKSLMNADKAYKNFMKDKAGFPRFKRRNGWPVGMYLPRNNAGDLKIQRHKGKIPTLGWVKFKEYGYIPCEGRAVSVTIKKRQAGRYYAAFVFEAEMKTHTTSSKTEGIGIDLGIKSFAVISDGRNYPNVNKTDRVRKLTRRLKREQRKFSRKIRKLKQRKEVAANKKCKRSNLDKQRLKVQRAFITGNSVL